MMGFIKITLGLHEQESWMHTHLVFFLSFHTLIALVHLLHGNPYSSCWHQLMGISIARWLSLSMWDFLLFCLLHTTSNIIFYSTHSSISMAHAHVLRESSKSWSTLKSINPNCLACHRGCAWWEHSCMMKMEHDQTIWFCRDELSLAMLFWEDMIAFLVCLKYYCLHVNIKLSFWILWISIFLPQ